MRTNLVKDVKPVDRMTQKEYDDFIKKFDGSDPDDKGYVEFFDALRSRFDKIEKRREEFYSAEFKQIGAAQNVIEQMMFNNNDKLLSPVRSAMGFNVNMSDELVKKIPDRVCDSMIGMLMLLKGGSMGIDLGEKATTIAKNIGDHIPDPVKLGEAMKAKPDLKIYGDFTELLADSLSEILAAIGKSDIDGAIDIGLKMIEKFRKSNGFRKLIDDLRAKMMPAETKKEKSDNVVEFDVGSKKGTNPPKKKEEKQNVEQKPVMPVAASQAIPPAAVMEQPATDHWVKIEDDPFDKIQPAFTTPEAIEEPEKPKTPAFIQESKVPQSNAQVPVDLGRPAVQPIVLDQLPAEAQEYFKKYPWALQIINFAANMGVTVQSNSIQDSTGKDVAVFFKSWIGDEFVGPMSFTVDLGNVIDRQYIAWMNFYVDGTTVFLEESNSYKLFVNGDIKKLNTEFLKDLFTVSCLSFNEDQQKKYKAYGPNITAANQYVVMISRPRLKKEQRESEKIIQDAMIQLASKIKDSPWADTRFILDRDNSDWKDIKKARLVFTNGIAKHYLEDVPVNYTPMTITLTPSLNDKNEFEREEGHNKWHASAVEDNTTA